MRDDIAKLKISQIKLLIGLWEKDLRITAANNFVKKVMMMLENKGYLLPNGKDSWRLNREAFTEKDIIEMEKYIDGKYDKISVSIEGNIL